MTLSKQNRKTIRGSRTVLFFDYVKKKNNQLKINQNF